MKSALRIVSLAVLLPFVVSCASTSSSSTGHQNTEKAINHVVTEQDKAFAASSESIKADTALLYVNGMGCPLCASNIDLQLMKVRGVKHVNVDLGVGTAHIEFVSDSRPSPAMLGHAVEDAGFTLVKIVSPAPVAGGGK